MLGPDPRWSPGRGRAELEVALRDVGRKMRLVDGEWRIYRYTRYEVDHEPERIVAELTRALARSSGTPLLSAPR